MPWKLRKAPKRDLYWVVNKETGKKYSKDPLPKETATAQMRALYSSEGKEGGMRAARAIKKKEDKPTVPSTTAYLRYSDRARLKREEELAQKERERLAKEKSDREDSARRLESFRVAQREKEVRRLAYIEEGRRKAEAKRTAVAEAKRMKEEAKREAEARAMTRSTAFRDQVAQLRNDSIRSLTAPSVAEFYSDTRYSQPEEGFPDIDWTPKRDPSSPRPNLDLSSVETSNKLKAIREMTSGVREQTNQPAYRTSNQYYDTIDEQHLLYTGLLTSRTGKPRSQEDVDDDVRLLLRDDHIRALAPNLRSSHSIAEIMAKKEELEQELQMYNENMTSRYGEDDRITSYADWKGFIYGNGKPTHRANFLKKNKLANRGHSLEQLAKISSVPLVILQGVYDRGIGAYKTNPSSVRLKGSYVKGVKAPMSKKLSKEQWAMARVYSFLDGNPKHDNDLRGGSRGGAVVSKNDLQQMAQAAYLGKERSEIGSFKLVHRTPTLKLYQNGNLIVVAVRGTEITDGEDIKADGLTIIGKLKDSSRYQNDFRELSEFEKNHPNFNYVGVGHSLGGAILDGFLRAGLVRNVVSYNALLEPQEIGGNPRHHRIYHSDDPIYKMVAHAIPGVEVRKGGGSFWKTLLGYALPFGLNTLFKAYEAHRISRFKGGYSCE